MWSRILKALDQRLVVHLISFPQFVRNTIPGLFRRPPALRQQRLQLRSVKIWRRSLLLSGRPGVVCRWNILVTVTKEFSHFLGGERAQRALGPWRFLAPTMIPQKRSLMTWSVSLIRLINACHATHTLYPVRSSDAREDKACWPPQLMVEDRHSSSLR